MPHRTISLEEVAEFLHLRPADVEELAKRGEIPVERAGGRLCFRKQEVEAWASARLLGFNDNQMDVFHKAASAKAHDLSKTHAIIPELMHRDWVHPNFAARTRASAIRGMVDFAEKTGICNYPEDLLAGVQEREDLCSTAMPGGIALLHPRNHEPYMFEDTFVVLARTIQPIPFGAPDGNLTDLFFLICSQADKIHLHILARLCTLCGKTGLLGNLREAADAKGMYDALVQAEEEVIKGL
jgi:PTS system nitrogen regulatory IIA component